MADEVATPMSCGGTAFCTARVSGCKLKPSPMPKTSMTISVCHSGVSTLDVVEDEAATTASSAEPMIGKIR